MCGRFTITIDLEEIIEYFEIARVEGPYKPLYNAAPTQEIPVVTGPNPRKLSFFHWGLIPYWAKEKSIGTRLINARAETLAQKPSFRQSYARKRCLIVADGFYEWKKSGRTKLPHRIVLKNGSPFAMAGLWDSWSLPGNPPLYSCTIITTEANNLLAPLHNRMPVILRPEDYRSWLDPAPQAPDSLNHLLKPYPPAEMDLYSVSSLVNSPANDFPQLILPCTDTD